MQLSTDLMVGQPGHVRARWGERGGKRGELRSACCQVPRSVLSLDSANAMPPIFQAGHEGSIPFARSDV